MPSRRPNGSLPVILFDLVPCAVPGVEGPCHVFRGSKGTRGYGKVGFEGKMVLVHRYVWIQTYGPIPDELELDHRCRNHGCCNAAHLRAVTHKVNSTENVIGANWQLNLVKTHCPLGHEYTKDNTRLRTRKNGKMCRECKVCARTNKQAKKKARRMAARFHLQT